MRGEGEGGGLHYSLPDNHAWRYSASARTCRPGVSVSWQGEIGNSICYLYLNVQHVNLSKQVRLPDTHCVLLGR